jgi:hypothetical protein
MRLHRGCTGGTGTRPSFEPRGRYLDCPLNSRPGATSAFGRLGSGAAWAESESASAACLEQLLQRSAVKSALIYGEQNMLSGEWSTEDASCQIGASCRTRRSPRAASTCALE